MKIKVTEEQLQAIVTNEQRNHVSARTKVRKSENEKENQTASKVVREEEQLDERSYCRKIARANAKELGISRKEALDNCRAANASIITKPVAPKGKSAVPDPGLPRISRFNEENLDEGSKRRWRKDWNFCMTDGMERGDRPNPNGDNEVRRCMRNLGHGAYQGPDIDPHSTGQAYDDKLRKGKTQKTGKKISEEELTEGFYQYIKENNIVEEDVNEELFDEWFGKLDEKKWWQFWKKSHGDLPHDCDRSDCPSSDGTRYGALQKKPRTDEEFKELNEGKYRRCWKNIMSQNPDLVAAGGTPYTKADAKAECDTYTSALKSPTKPGSKRVANATKPVAPKGKPIAAATKRPSRIRGRVGESELTEEEVLNERGFQLCWRQKHRIGWSKEKAQADCRKGIMKKPEGKPTAAAAPKGGRQTRGQRPIGENKKPFGSEILVY